MADKSIDVADLRLVVERIFDFMQKDLSLQEVALDENYYWQVAEDDLYSIKQAPEQLDVGSLLDDWEFVQSAKLDPEQALPLLLLHVAPLLRALATKVPNFPR